MANRIRGGSEIRICQLARAVKRKVQVLITAKERPVRVVQEIISRETKLEFLGFRFSESKILKHG
jgi:hypothetical protein